MYRQFCAFYDSIHEIIEYHAETEAPVEKIFKQARYENSVSFKYLWKKVIVYNILDEK